MWETLYAQERAMSFTDKGYEESLSQRTTVSKALYSSFAVCIESVVIRYCSLKHYESADA